MLINSNVAWVKQNYGNYNELIFAVQTKYEGETRHQTALRYIEEAERHSEESAQEAKNED